MCPAVDSDGMRSPKPFDTQETMSLCQVLLTNKEGGPYIQDGEGSPIEAAWYLAAQDDCYRKERL